MGFSVQEFRREVRSVGPNQGVKFRVNLEPLEFLDGLQGLEDRTDEFRAEIDLPVRSIPNPKPHGIARNVFCFNNVGRHCATDFSFVQESPDHG